MKLNGNTGTMITLLGVMCLHASLFAQAREETVAWAPFQYFVGSWQGRESGKAGIGKGERVYDFIMGGTYLFGKNVSRFEPQEKNPKGEVHQDWVIVSYDKDRKNFVSREFHSEGYVIRYLLDKEASTEKKLVLLSEAVENASGLRARLTLRINSEQEFEETFELAGAGKEFQVYIKNLWTRVSR